MRSIRRQRRNGLIDELTRSLGEDGVLTDPRDLEVYRYDASAEGRVPQAVVLPRSTEEVVAVVASCAARGVPITPRGCATSLSGGPVPLQGGVVLSLTRLNRIIEIDEVNLRAVVQPGVINADLNEAVSQYGLFYAPDPASQIACSMGGNVAENAGGPHCLKYGVTANHVTGLTIVTAEAHVLQLGGRALLNSKLDLRGLVIGSEGTLGVITEITCRLLPAPPAMATMLACFPGVEEAAEAVSEIIGAGLLPATIEMVDRLVIEAIEQYDKVGYPEDVGAVLVVEIDGLGEALGRQVERVQEVCQRHGVLRFEWAEDAKEREELWRGRKGATAALSLLAPGRFSTDVTVPRTRLPEALTRVSQISHRFGVPIGNVFHAGDGNLHPQVLFDPRNQEQMARAMAADEAVTEMALELGGVITGEHGIGSEKRKWMTRACSLDELRAMWAVKKAFDPKGLLNPGKVLPDEKEIEALATTDQREALQEVAIGVAEPATEAEAVDLAGACARDGVALNMPDQSRMKRADCVEISVERLKRVCEYDPGNLTVTVEAGMTVGELQAVVGEQGQTIGAWRGLPPDLTVGSVVATARPTPSMTRYGAARDIVTGLRVAVSGRLLRLGSSCVKNVSGYAMERLFVGSFCSLGLILAATVRTHPLPEGEAEVMLRAATGGVFASLVRGLLRCPASIVQARAWPAGREPTNIGAGNGWTVEVRVGGWREELGPSLNRVTQAGADQGAEIVYCSDEQMPGEKAKEPVCSGRDWLRDKGGVAVYCLAPMKAVEVATERPDVVLELWPLAGIVAVDTSQPLPRTLTAETRLASSAADLFANNSSPSGKIAQRLKQAFDPAGLLPPWNGLHVQGDQ
jgi:D-lactate dehydrogenase (cytochrome)